MYSVLPSRVGSAHSTTDPAGLVGAGMLEPIPPVVICPVMGFNCATEMPGVGVRVGAQSTCTTVLSCSFQLVMLALTRACCWTGLLLPRLPQSMVKRAMFAGMLYVWWMYWLNQ